LVGFGHVTVGWDESSDGALLAQTFTAELYPVCVVDDPIGDRVGQCWIADDLVAVSPRTGSA
jgi:hypothetical protein